MNQKSQPQGQPGKTLKNLLTRTMTGALLVAAVLGSIIWHPLAFTFLSWALMITGLHEFYRLADYHGIKPGKVLGYLVSSSIFFVTALAAAGVLPMQLLVLIPVLLSLFFAAELFRNRQDSVLNLAFSILAVVFITIPLALLTFFMNPQVTDNPAHWHLLFAYFVILWSHDTFAYLTGLLIGRHKLYERISPKKTWEGSMGGLIFALAASFIISLFFDELSLWQWIAAGFIISVTGTLGDLSESLLKRRFNVKDSGTVFPGHGGVLDRFDAVLFSAPALLCYLILIRL